MKETVKKYIPSLLYAASCLLLFAAINAAVDNQSSFTVFFDGWWTLFITVPAVNDMVNRGFKTENIITFVCGTVLFLSLQDFSSQGAVWKIAFPIIILIIGLSIAYKGYTSKKNDTGFTLTAVFSKNEATAEEGEEIKDFSCLALFGNAVIDLTKAQLTEETNISIVSVFSTVTLLLPEDTYTDAKGLLLFGGCRNLKTGQDTKTDYTCVFGEIMIK